LLHINTLSGTSGFTAIRRVNINKCLVYRCGYESTRYQGTESAVTGIDYCEGGSGQVFEDIIIRDSRAEECWEAGFHCEPAPHKKTVLIDGCVAVNNTLGDGTQLSTKLYSANFLVQPFNGLITINNCKSYGANKGVHIGFVGTSGVARIINTEFINTSGTPIYSAQTTGGDLSIIGGSIKGTPRYAIQVYSPNTLIEGMKIETAGISGYGIVIGSAAAPVSNVKLDDVHIVTSGVSYGVQLYYITDLRMNRCRVETLGTKSGTSFIGVDIAASNRANISDSYITAGTIGLRLVTSNSGVSIQNSTFDGGTYGISDSASNNLMIRNNLFSKCSYPFSTNNINVINTLVMGNYWAGNTNDPISQSSIDIRYISNIGRSGNANWYTET
jgi:hypothetical protein